MKLIRTAPTMPTWKQGRTFTIEVTEGDLLQMARLSYEFEGGPQFPRGVGKGFVGEIGAKMPRLHEKIQQFAPDIAKRAEERITPEDTI